MTGEIYKPGQTYIEEITLVLPTGRMDIRNFVIQSVFYEDIFNNVMTGYLVVTDAANLINNLVLSGKEYVKCTFTTSGFSSSLSMFFSVTSISERILDANDQAYSINLMSPVGVIDNNTVLSEKFSGSTSNIIGDIYNRYLKVNDKPVRVGRSHITNTTFVSPNWSPLQTINWITNRAYSNAPSMLFYETNKSFYLASIEELMERGATDIYDSYLFSPVANTNLSISNKYSLIKSMTPFKFFDVLDAQDYGYYGGTLFVHDITTKSLKKTSFSALNNFNKNKKVEGSKANPVVTNYPHNKETFRVVKTQQKKLFDEYPDPNYASWVLQRNSLMYEASNLRFSITVPGKTDIEVGRVINCVFPKSTAKDVTSIGDIDNFLDPYLSGKYLITAICHQITADTHEMVLEIVKDSFVKNIG